MMLRLTAGRPERAAVLSTMDANTRARRLYRRLGFTDLLTGFTFPGTELPYAIMGAPLPLPGAQFRTKVPSIETSVSVSPSSLPMTRWPVCW